jgi:gliding motility-associated-like protein
MKLRKDDNSTGELNLKSLANKKLQTNISNFFHHMKNITIQLLVVSVLVAAQCGSLLAGWNEAPSYPKAFIQNKSQFDGRNKIPGSRVLYAIDHGPFQVYFTQKGITYRLDEKLPRKKWDKTVPLNNEEEFLKTMSSRRAVNMNSDIIHMNWLGVNSNVEVIASEPVDHYFNYSMGSNNITYNNIKGYQKLTYKNLYQGIDLVYEFHPESGFKYSFIIHPGADASVIRFQYSDNTGISMDENGNVRLKTRFGDIIDHAPISFYADEKSKKIATRFSLQGKMISFKISKYNSSRKLVLDPWTLFPSSPNSNKVWEVETDSSGNVYTYSGDMPITLRKYNSSGALQWTYLTSLDSSGYWIGGMKSHPNGDVYITSGSNGEIRKILPSGTQQWFHNPNLLTSYEYWSMAFNCDFTKLVIGGTRLTFSIPFPIIRGAIMNINLNNGSILSTTEVGYGNVVGIPPNVQEVSSICSAPNGAFYFLTLDTVGALKDDLTTMAFKTGTGYNFDYYIPGYGFGTKQPISAIRATLTHFYTHNGVTIHKRAIGSGAILATASIPSGISNNTFFGTKVQGNGGLDIDSCGNVYVGSSNGVYKFDSNLNLIGSASTPGPVYDVAITSYGEVAASGNNFVTSVALSVCNIPASICITSVVATATATDITCNGFCDGTATTAAIGGTPPYSYLWSTGQTTPNISGLCAGTYSVIVTDSTTASDTAFVTISEPDPLVTSATVVDALCGSNNGSISLSVTGGVGSYSFQWNPSVSTDSIANGLAAGAYNIVIADSNGCSDTVMVTVNSSGGPNINIVSQTDAFCYGSSSGTASVSASSGTPPYNYTWNTIPVTTGPFASGLPAGTYIVTVTDSLGCTGSQNITISEPDSLHLVVTVLNHALCGNANATLTASASGGIPAYNFVWNTVPLQAGDTITGVPPGTYTVTVIDSNFCTTSVSVTVLDIQGPDVNITSVTNITCYGGSNGSVNTSVTGGLAPYTYLWSTSPPQNTSNATGLTAGTYTVTVTDQNNCSFEQTAFVTQPPELVLTTNVQSATCGLPNGVASVNVTGGTPGYTYSWNTSPPQTGTTAVNLPAGTYTVTVIDANNCTENSSVTVGDSPSLNTAATSQPACGEGNGSASVVVSGGTPPYSYSWSPSGGNGPTATGLNNGTYTCVITDANGCADIASINVIVYPGVVADAGTDVTIEPGSVVQLNASSGNSWSWIPATGLSCVDCQNPVAGPANSTTYCVTITDSDGCTGTDCVNVTVDIDCGEVYVPNAFSPDGANHPENERQCVYGRCITDMEFAIFNRWGQKVFESSDPKKCWDGTYKGKEMNGGVYVYYLKARLLDGSVVNRKGDISLIR